LGLKVVKQLGFAFVAAAALTVSAPAVSQSLAPVGYEFTEAVKKSDANKALEILAAQPPGIVNTKDGEGNTPLLIAIARNDEQWAGFMLNKGADPNLAGKGGNTPLIAAARVGMTQAVEWLLGLGAKVDGTNKMGETALIAAVQQRNLPIVRLLLSKGADPDKTDSAAGYSARDYATRDGRSREILKALEDKKPKTAAAATK
jgi:ankyrin repeat protein